MTHSFNLINQPWIPCVDQDGLVGELSLRETLNQAHNLHGIAGDSPLETAAIYRLLLAVLHSALRGPESASAWNELWQAGTWNTPWLKDYLDRWCHRFDLFDPERPFYQARDERVKPKSIISLVIDMASGNNAVLFDHHTEDVGEELSPSKAARVLVVAQNFNLAGLSGLEQKFTDAPWGRGIIFLVEGDNLFQTLALNLLRYDDNHPSGFVRIGYDCPAWESDDPFHERDCPRGYLDYLTWQNRRIVLFPEGNEAAPIISQMTVAPGLRLNASVLDPFKNYRKDEKTGHKVTRFYEEKALWRDSSALFNVKEHSQNHPPENFIWISVLADRGYIENQRLLRFMALGMANDQAKVEFFRQEMMPLPLPILEDSHLVGILDSALLMAAETRASLRIAASWMAVLIVSPGSDGKRWQEISKLVKDQADGLYNHWTVDTDFWGAMEIPFFHLLDKLPEESDLALNEWKDVLKQSAWRVLEKAADQAGDRSRALKAAVRARSILGSGIKKLFPIPEKEVYE